MESKNVSGFDRISICCAPRPTLYLPDVLLFSVLHDDDGARQWNCLLRPGSTNDDTKGMWYSA